MSYEGYTEHLCKNGHLFVFNCYAEPDKPVCPTCKEPPVWSHAVDQTNGVEVDENGVPYPSTVPYPLEVLRVEKRRVTVSTSIYKVPGKAGEL